MYKHSEVTKSEFNLGDRSEVTHSHAMCGLSIRDRS
jgi:hypothetical protein